MVARIFLTGLFVAFGMAFVVQLRSGQDSFRYYPYVPAMYAGDRRLVLFPLTGQKEEVSLPVPLGGYAVSPDGRTLYTTSGMGGGPQGSQAVLYRIDFRPARLEGVLGSDGFRFLSSFAVSLKQDTVVAAGRYWDGTRLLCGVFELGIPNGRVRQVSDSRDCTQV
jgi:hypothetical protein